MNAKYCLYSTTCLHGHFLHLWYQMVHELNGPYLISYFVIAQCNISFDRCQGLGALVSVCLIYSPPLCPKIFVRYLSFHLVSLACQSDFCSSLGVLNCRRARRLYSQRHFWCRDKYQPENLFRIVQFSFASTTSFPSGNFASWCYFYDLGRTWHAAVNWRRKNQTRLMLNHNQRCLFIVFFQSLLFYWHFLHT